MQTDFSSEKAKFIAGQITRATQHRHIATRVATQAGRPKIVTFTFTGTWAANDDIATVINGTAVTTTNIVGDSPEEAATEHRATILASAAAMEYIESVEDDEEGVLTITSKQLPDGNGDYYDPIITNSVTTAGDGDITVATAQTRLNRGDLKFGLGLAAVTTDATGKQVTLPAANGFVFAGVALHVHSTANRALQGDDGIPANEPIAAMMQGYCAVRIDSDVAAAIASGTRAVYLKHTLDGNGGPGQFRHNNTNANAVPAVFTGRVEGSLAEIFLNAP